MRRPVAIVLALFLIAWTSDSAHAQSSATQNRPDPFVEQLRVKAEQQVHPVMRLSLNVDDGRVFEWHSDFVHMPNTESLAKSLGIASKKQTEILDAYVASINQELFDFTRAAVESSNRDPQFNPRTDIKFSVGGHILPTTQPDKAQKDDWYWISFTGLRRNALLAEGAQIIRSASGDPDGGEITVKLNPDRVTWHFRETITGKLSITNTGMTRVRILKSQIGNIAVANAGGLVPKSFRMMGNVDYGLDAPLYKFLSVGETWESTFQLFTDRAHTMEFGYYLSSGEWQLKYDVFDGDNIRAIGTPVRIQVRTAHDEYTGPRIERIDAAGPNLFLRRERDIFQVIDVDQPKPLATTRPSGFAGGWGWRESRPVLSSDGQMLAFAAKLDGPIIIERLIGEQRNQFKLLPPDGVTLGDGGFFPGRFSIDGKSLYCFGRNLWMTLDLESGKLERATKLSEMWTDISPDGKYAVTVDGALARVIGSRGKDQYRIRIFDLHDAARVRVETIRNHGDTPSMHLGNAGIYLCDEFNRQVLFMPYSGAPLRTFDTGATPDFVGETTDGSLVAFKSPGIEDDLSAKPISIGVYQVADGKRVSKFEGNEPAVAALLSSPPRIVLLTRNFVQDEYGGGSWLSEAATVFDALSGELMKSIDLTPSPGSLPDTDAE